MSSVLSPTTFYITFSHGTKDVATLQPSDITQHHQAKFSHLRDSIQMLYQGNCRKLYINSLPTPDSLLVTRSERDKLWNRAMVRGDCAEGEVEVF